MKKLLAILTALLLVPTTFAYTQEEVEKKAEAIKMIVPLIEAKYPNSTETVNKIFKDCADNHKSPFMVDVCKKILGIEEETGEGKHSNPMQPAEEKEEKKEILNPDLRSVKRGMTKEEVKEQEGVSKYENDETLMYRVSMQGHNYELYYTFYNGKLVSASYKLSDSFVSENDYIEIFQGLSKIYSYEYGVPRKYEYVSYPFENTSSDWGVALSQGALEFEHKRYTPTSQIDMKLQKGIVGPEITIEHVFDK